MGSRYVVGESLKLERYTGSIPDRDALHSF